MSQGLSWGCSQDVGWGYSHKKAWLGQEDPLPRWGHSHSSWHKASVFFSIWASFFLWYGSQLPSERVMGGRERERRKLNSLLNLILEVIHHQSCHILLAPRTKFNTMWKGNIWRCDHWKMDIIKGLLGVWPPHTLDVFRLLPHRSTVSYLTPITFWWEGKWVSLKNGFSEIISKYT